ncbi:adenylate kinase 9-like [Clavelina lepadiformis]|uniref:adenylate kinase 9-like n=1 Tax=Clavelina lepadiformis TaxID=159417 RepID=UPI004042B058
MKIPSKYSNLKLPNKLPPKKQPTDIVGLPMLGYLEQGAATSVIKALTAVGCLKPKYPFLSVQRSFLSESIQSQEFRVHPQEIP